MKKILAIIPAKVDGCAYHRVQVPLVNLKGFDLTQVIQLDAVSDLQLKAFDIVWFNRLNGIGEPLKQIERLKRIGIPYVVDFDDNWTLPQEHILYEQYKQNKTPEMLLELLKNAAYVLVTHDYLANKVKTFNKKVAVLPNAIDPEQPQWQTPTKVKETHTAFGWCGGITHWDDLAMLRQSLKRVHADNKMHLVIGGYSDTTVWNHIKNWFGNNGRYNKTLCVPGKDVYNYGSIYDYMSTVLIPLKNTEFNRCKSELKMLEAGFKKKAVIVSNIHPYTNVITDKNCLTVGDGQHNWFKHMSRIQRSKDLEQDLAAQLYEDIKIRYHINTVNKIREQIFNSL